MNSTLSCSLVLFRQNQQVLKTIACLQASTVDVDLYVIDNSGKNRHGMANRIKWQCPGAQILIPKHSRNIGYGRGHNLTRRLITSTYHLILSPGVTFDSSLLRQMMDFMDENPDVAILSPKFLHTDGSEDPRPRLLPTVRFMASKRFRKISHSFRELYGQYTLENQSASIPVDVNMAPRGFMLMRTHVYRDLLENGFDPRFFLHMEDADISLQVRELSHVYPHKIIYNPAMSVTCEDAGGKSRMMPFHTAASAAKYFLKWHLVW